MLEAVGLYCAGARFPPPPLPLSSLACAHIVLNILCCESASACSSHFVPLLFFFLLTIWLFSVSIVWFGLPYLAFFTMPVSCHSFARLWSSLPAWKRRTCARTHPIIAQYKSPKTPCPENIPVQWTGKHISKGADTEVQFKAPVLFIFLLPCPGTLLRPVAELCLLPAIAIHPELY